MGWKRGDASSVKFCVEVDQETVLLALMGTAQNVTQTAQQCEGVVESPRQCDDQGFYPKTGGLPTIDLQQAVGNCGGQDGVDDQIGRERTGFQSIDVWSDALGRHREIVGAGA